MSSFSATNAPILEIQIPSHILHDSSSMSIGLSPFGFSIISTSAGHILQRQKRRAPNSFELQRSPPPCSSCLSRQVLLSAKNSEISSLLLEIRRLNHLNNDLLAKEEDSPNIIPRGLALAAQRLKTLPDVFSCLDTWCKYDDQKFLEHMDAFGAGELVHALQDIILRTFKLLHPLDPSPSQQFLAPKVSRMCSILFDAIMKPGQYQSVSSWAWALLVKLQCKSSKTVDFVCRLLPGGPSSDVQLSSRLGDAADNITKNEAFSKTISTLDIDLLVRWDNAPASNKGYIHKSKDITDTTKNRIITILEYGFTKLIQAGKASLFTQNILSSDNDPALWKAKFATVDPATILTTDPRAQVMIDTYYISQIQLCLDKMISKNYIKGSASSLFTTADKPVIRGVKRNFLSTAQIQRKVHRAASLQPFFFSPLPRSMAPLVASMSMLHEADLEVEEDDEELSEEDIINALQILNEEDEDVESAAEAEDENQQRIPRDLHTVEAEENNNEINSASSIFSCNDEILFLGHDTKVKVESSGVSTEDDDDFTIIPSNSFIRRCMQASVRTLNASRSSTIYENTVTFVRGSHYNGNPASTEVQEILTKRVLTEACVKGFVDPKKVKRGFINISTDLKAFMHGWWNGPYFRANHIIGTLHQDMNMGKCERRFEANSDRKTSPCLARLLRFTSLSALRMYFGAQDTHKNRQISLVIGRSKLDTLVKFSYDRGTGNEFNINNKECAQNIYRELLLPGGGHVFQSLVAEVFHVILPRELVHACACRRNHFLYVNARLDLIYMACGDHMSDYGPAMIFDTIRYRHLYSKTMREWHDNFFVYQTEDQHANGVAYQGWDNGIEVGIKNFKFSLSGVSEKACVIANYMSSSIRAISVNFLDLVGLRYRGLKHVAALDLSELVDDVTYFLDWHGTGRRISATADDGKFWSYDRLEEKDPKHAVHNILAESKKRAMDYVGYFATTGGKMKPVEASLLIPCSFLTGKKKSVVVSES